MNNSQTNTSQPRTGTIVALVALLLPVFIAFIAFAVDYGVILVAKLELQNAADAAAVSTLQALQSSSKQFADQTAFETITHNQMLGAPIEFDMEQSVEYGNWDEDSMSFTPIPRQGSPSSSTDVSGDSIPAGASAVRIRLTRSNATNNAIPLFFAQVIGTSFAEIQVEAIASGTAGCSGFVGIESVTLLNNLITDAYNSDDGSYDPTAAWDPDYSDPNANRFPEGDVCSNGHIHLASGADVYGDAVGSPVTIAHGSGAMVSGNIGSPSSERAYDSVDFNEANINDNDTIERGPTWAPPFLTPDGDLIVNNGRNITLESGKYRFRDMKLAGGSELKIEGDVEIYIEREMRFDNGTVANASGIPMNFSLLVGAGPVNIQGGHQLHSVIYAPDASVTIANGSGFFGSIVGKTLDVAGGAGLHYDLSLADEEESGGPAKLVH